MALMRIFLAGHRGMAGGAILRRLKAREGTTVITRDRDALDLTDQAAVRAFFDAERPDAVILAAARVGGIAANMASPAEFIRDNLMMASTVIHEAHAAGVPRLVQIASSSIYPPAAPQPLREEVLLTGPPDPSHRPYAIAKIAGITLCDSYHRQYGRDYRTVVPTNLYGPGDRFDPETSHVLPALIRRFHEATREGRDAVTLWGSGRPLRDFLHVDDMAEACLFVLDLPETAYRRSGPGHINLGSGAEISIAALARMIAGVAGFGGEIRFDTSRPDGAPRKLLDAGRLAGLGWRARIGLREGIAGTHDWYSRNLTALRCGDKPPEA